MTIAPSPRSPVRSDDAPQGETRSPSIVLAAAEMGYGHLRAARALAEELQLEIVRADLAPVAGLAEQRLWKVLRFGQDWVSQTSQRQGVLNRLMGAVLDGITAIPPLHEVSSSEVVSPLCHVLAQLIQRGLGAGLVSRVYEEGPGTKLLTTFYSPAIAADALGLDEVYCVVTDSDIQRVWAPLDPARTRIRYLAPTLRAARRLVSYGVPETQVAFTGFPLPGSLLGGPDLPVLRGDLARRLARLDVSGIFRSAHGADIERQLGRIPADAIGAPPLLTFAVGGAGAQAEHPEAFLTSLAPEIRHGRLRLALVAGVRPEVEARFHRAVARVGLAREIDRSISIVYERRLDPYLTRFTGLLRETDILWTKPSELSFFAALGLPIVIAPPVGAHERHNRRWLREHGAGLKEQTPRHAAGWLHEWLVDGTLAGAAWSGFVRLPKHGTYRIAEELERWTSVPENPRPWRKDVRLEVVANAEVNPASSGERGRSPRRDGPRGRAS